MIKKESAGGVIVNESGEVVMVFSDTKSWQFPKGTVEPQEIYLQTAIREIEEETGLKGLQLIRKLPMYTRTKGEVSRDIHYFLFKITKQELKPSAEVTKAEWVHIDSAEEMLTYKEDKEFFRKIKAELKSLL